MRNEILFSEQQRFKQWWVWAILIAIDGLLLFGVFTQVIGGQQFGDKPMSNLGLLLVTGLTVLLTLSFVFFSLETQIRKDGIYVRYFPFHRKMRHYAWDSMKKSYVRKYSPIREYGGWGLSAGGLGKGRAINVSGNQGLQLEFLDHKKLLIGTNKPEEIRQVLRRLGQLKD